MNEEENDGYEEDLDESEQQDLSGIEKKARDISNRSKSLKSEGIKKGGDVAKKSGKKLAAKGVKFVAKVAVNAVKILGKIIMSIPWPVWVAIIVIIILVVTFFMLQNQLSATDSTYNHVGAYVHNKQFQEAEENKTIIEDFQKKESMLLFKLIDIDNIYKAYTLQESEKDVLFAEMLSTKLKDGNKNLPNMPGGAVSVNQERELYKHILMTQKYDFNNINWKEFSRKNIKGSPITKIKVDGALGLRYPDDPKKKLEDFTKQLYPYLQTWHIPMAMFSGSLRSKNIDSPKDIAFAYTVIAEAGSKIDMNKYIIETYTETIVTEDWGNGDRTSSTTSSSTTKEEYKLGEVFTFDKWFRNKNEFIPYDKNGAPNSSNTTTKDISRQIVRNDNVNGTNVPVAITQTGTKTTTVNTWADKLKGTTDSKGTHYTALDVENFINNNEGNSRE